MNSMSVAFLYVLSIFLKREFSIEKSQGREVINLPENLKNLNILL